MKGRIVARYRSQLTAWFLSRFFVRGRVPFETLKGLRATAVVTFSGRTMSGFTVSTTGHAAFDREVASTLQSLRGRDAPMPPDGHHSLLEKPFPVVFQCTSRSQCE